MLRILTLNLWNINQPLHHRMAKLEEYLAWIRPDIITLQEISPVDNIPQSNQLAKSLGYISHYTYSGMWQGREQGLATLTRVDSRVEEVISLTEAPNDMPRVAVAVIVSTSLSKSEIAIINTHLSFHIDQGAFRQSQMRECLLLADRVARGGARGVMLCGDFNEDSGGVVTELIRADASLKLLDCWTACHPESDAGHTFARENLWADSTLWPGRRIDYIFVSSQRFRPISCNLVLTGVDGWGPVSDHYGVLAHVEEV